MMPWGDLLRASVVAVLAWLAGLALRRALASGRAWAWVLLAIPMMTPTLLTGYAYSNTLLALVHHPLCNELWYALLLVLKLTPVAAVVLYVAPRPLTAEAQYCRRLAQGRVGWRFRWASGCSRAPLTAMALVLILAFGEFELASLMNVRTWAVRLFDGHAGGLPLFDSISLVAGPLAVEAVVLCSVLVLLARQTGAGACGGLRQESAGMCGWVLLVAANLVVSVVPAVVVLRGTVEGVLVLMEDFALSREIGMSLALGAVAALGAYAVAPRRWWVGVAVSLPGLLGPLVLALLVGALVQVTWWCGWGETPLPLAFTLVALVMPLAVLLRQLLRRTAPAAAVHVARLLGGQAGRQAIWELQTRRHVWAIFLLFCGAYFDLTASAILAPVGMTPVSVRLYNLMHYGQTAVLSTMVMAAFQAPLAIWLVVLATRRLWMRI